MSDVDYLLELLISRHEKRKSQQERVNEMPLYPTEKIIWDENIVPVEYYSGEGKKAYSNICTVFHCTGKGEGVEGYIQSLSW